VINEVVENILSLEEWDSMWVEKKYIMGFLMIWNLHLNSSINKIEKNKWEGHVTCMGDWRVLYRFRMGNLS